MPDRVPAEVRRPREIHRKCPLPMVLPVLVGHLVYRMRLEDAGVVYQNIDTPQFRNGFSDKPLGCVGVRDITGTADMTSAGKTGR